MGFIEWLLKRVIYNDDYEEDEDIDDIPNESQPSSFSVKNNKEVFFKNISSVEDIKTLIDYCKKGSVCVAQFGNAGASVQNLKNYLSGAVYAIDGNVTEVSNFVYVICT